MLEVLQLDVDQVHIWTVSFDLPDDLVANLIKLLSAEEKKKADRFKFPHLKRQYTVFHATLRKMLAYYLGVNEKKIAFTRGTYGKPAVSEDINHLNIQFSMSKSSESGVYAFMIGNEIGIDIEKINQLPDMVNIVKRHFTTDENHIFENMQDKEKLGWFYTVWTRKEALLKAIGTGLYVPLENIDVANIKNIKINSKLFDKHVSSLYLSDLQMITGFRSAICMYN